MCLLSLTPSAPLASLLSCVTLTVSALQQTSTCSFQRICGLSGPRNHQKTDRRRVHRGSPTSRRQRTRPRRHARRADAGRPHQRRSPRHPGSLLRRDAPAAAPTTRKCSRRSRTNWCASTRRCYENEPRQSQQARARYRRRAGRDGQPSTSSKTAIRSAWKSAASWKNFSREEARSTRPPARRSKARSAPSSKAPQEWDILYRKYYNEEVKKLGI